MSATPAGGRPYVITLATSWVPMPLLVPFVHELESFSVFRSRDVERGRKRFGLHVGYFATEVQACEALRVVRHYYPYARVNHAPQSGAGSLDDTLNTSFTVMRNAAAQVAAVRPAAAPRPAEPRPTPAPPDAGPQRYAVQLDLLSAAAGPTRLAKLDIFDAYNLYRIRVQRARAPLRALRLGFFTAMESAEQVAYHVRGRYPRASVVPVSAREYGFVLELMQRRARVELLSLQPQVQRSATVPAKTAAHPTIARPPMPPADEVSFEFRADELAVDDANAAAPTNDREAEELAMELACADLLALGQAKAVRGR